MKIKAFHPKKRRALFVVDVQHGFIRRQKPEYIEAIKQVIKTGEYDLFVEASFHAPKGSIWDKQMNWIFPYEKTIPEVLELLPKDKTISIIKTTKSVFATKTSLANTLRKKGIEEIHLVGFDINDCVFTTAQDGFDLGFETYIIEEACGSSNGEKIRDHALAILRKLYMTNHSEK